MRNAQCQRFHQNNYGHDSEKLDFTDLERHKKFQTIPRKCLLQGLQKQQPPFAVTVKCSHLSCFLCSHPTRLWYGDDSSNHDIIALCPWFWHLWALIYAPISSYTFGWGHTGMLVVMKAFVMILHSSTPAIFTPLYSKSRRCLFPLTHNWAHIWARISWELSHCGLQVSD